MVLLDLPLFVSLNVATSLILLELAKQVPMLTKRQPTVT
nr:MAG: hypothetical protein AmFV_00285 [Apis mellifera filamentous virus]WOK43397.1 MAG: hypothetical protein [Apis mellifera filamentous virus]